MIEALAVGVTFALILASVAIACLAYKLPSLWQSRDLRTDQYLTEKTRADGLAIRLKAVEQERDAANKTIEQRDQEVARLSAVSRKERRDALDALDGDELIARANRVSDSDAGGGEAGGSPGASSGPSSRTVPR